MDVTTTSGTNDEPTHLTSKIECDVLILRNSISRRIKPKRFTSQGKTIVRFIRGGAKTCTNFVEKNSQRYNAKNILINIGTRDLQGEGVKEDEFSPSVRLVHKDMGKLKYLSSTYNPTTRHR
jgi:hypothetical protein